MGFVVNDTITEQEMQDLLCLMPILDKGKPAIKKLITHYNAAKDNQWVSVDDQLPPEDEKVLFWLIPKPPEECMHDSSGNPILSNHPHYSYVCRWECWSAASKPTHWQPLLPAPQQSSEPSDKPKCPKHDTGGGPCYCHIDKPEGRG
jgi:hypothetical protein